MTRDQYIADLRKKYPQTYSPSMPDELVYHIGRKADPRAKVEDWEEMGYSGGEKIYKTDPIVSPSGWNELILKDINDDSWEWVKHAYANSLQGTLDQWWNGKLDYDIEKDYEELNIGEKILAGVGSFVMPLDLLTLRIGAPFVGKLMSGTTKAIGTKLGGKKIIESSAVQGLIAKANAVGMKLGLSDQSLGVGLKKAIMSGNVLGLYEGAKGGLSADLNGEDVFEGVAHGYTHGAMMGAVFGGVGGTMEANFLKYKMLKEARVAGDLTSRGGFTKNYSIPELDKLMNYTGKGGQYAAEVASIQAFSLTDAIKNGELKGDQLLEQLIVDAGFVKVMNVKNKALSKVMPTLKSYKKSLNDAYIKASEKKEKTYNPKDEVGKEIENIIKSEENKGDEQSLNNAKVLRNAITEVKDNIPVEDAGKILPELVKVDKLIRQYEYLQERFKEDMTMSQINDQIAKVQEYSELQLKTIGELEKGYNSGKIKDELYRAKADENYQKIQELEESLYKRKSGKEQDIIKKQAQAKIIHDNLSVKNQYSKKEFDKILKNEEALNSFIEGAMPQTGSQALMEFSRQIKKSADYKKDIERKYELGTNQRELADQIAKDWEKIEKDQAGLKDNSKGLEKLEDSKKIVGYFAQNETIRKGKTVSSALLKSGPKRVREMFSFAKFLAKKGKSFEDAIASDVETFLLKKPSYHTMMNELVPFLKLNNLSPKLIIGKARITSLGTKTPEWGKEGFRTDHESWLIEKDKLSFRASKTSTEDLIEKPISKELSKSLVELSKSDLPAKEGGHKSFMFRLNTGEAMVNEDLHSMWNSLFGKKYKVPEKGKKTRVEAGARAMRKTLQQFAEYVAGERLGIQPDYAKKIISHNILKDKPDMTAIDKSYGPDRQMEIAKNIVKEFVKEVNKKNPVKYKTEDWYYTPSEIKAGLNKLANRKNDVFKMQGRQYSKQMLEPMIKYIIETAPRINEIVPKTTELNKHLNMFTKMPKEMPPPPQTDVDISIGYVKKSKIPHKDPSSFGKFKGATKKEQERILSQKDVVIKALQGTPESSGYKIAAKQSLESFINVHERWRDYVRNNPKALKRNPNIGDVAHHTKWIKRYKDTLKLLDKAPEKLEYGVFAGKNERNKLVSVAKDIQNKIGIAKGEKQLSEKAYKKQLLEDTEGLFGKGVESLSAKANPSLNIEQLYDYVNFIGSENYLNINKRWRGRKNTVDEMARDRGITNKKIENLLMEIGVKDGKWENIKSKKTVDYVISWLNNYEKLSYPKTTTDIMADKLIEGSFGKFPSLIRTAFTAPIQVFYNEKLAGKAGPEVIKPLVNRPITITNIRGMKDKYTDKIDNLIPKDKDKALLLTDTELASRWKKEGSLTSEELKFIDKSFDNKTKEYEAKKVIREYFDKMWNLWGEYGKENTKNPRILEEIESALGKMYVEDYFLRRLNPKLIDALVSSKTILTEKSLENMLKEETKKYVNAQVRKNIKRKKGEKDKSFQNRQKDERVRLTNDKDTKNAVAEIIWNFTRMKPHQLKNTSFLKRGVTFPRYIEIKDSRGNIKKINSYLEKWNESFEYYGNAQANHLATWRHMPEFTSLGKELKLGKYKANLFDYLTGKAKKEGLNVSSKWADYLGMLLEAELGMEGSYKERHNKSLYRWGGIAASTGASMGLSTPIVPGIKNLATAMANAAGPKPLSTTFQGWMKYFDLQERKKYREKGYGSYFNTIITSQKNIFEEMGISEKVPFKLGEYLNVDKIFKMNLMEQTEGIARISDSMANGLYAQQLIDAYKGNKNVVHKFMSKKMLKKQFEFTAKNLFRWTPSELEFVKKTKYEDLFSETKTNKHTNSTNFNAMRWMLDKAEFYGQAATQGGTNPLMLPLWMSGAAFKPLTLFTRIATSVTAGMWTNQIRPIWETGNPMPLVRYAAGSVFTGAGLYAFYKYIMGQDQMHEMSDEKWKTVLQWAWRAEFLGMFSNMFNPHMSPIYGSNTDSKMGVDPAFVTDFFEPYMLRSGRAIVEGISTVMTDPTNPKGWSQAIKHVTKTSVAFAGQASKQWDRLFYPEMKEWNKFRTAARSFKKEKGYDTPNFKLNTARQIYYRDLKNNFWKGDEVEFAKSYYAAIAQIDTELLRDGYVDPNYRRKQAVRSIEQSLESMNPVNFSANIKGREMSKRNEFLNYLKNYDVDVYNQARKSETQFQFKLRKLLSIVHQSKYRKNYSPYYNN